MIQFLKRYFKSLKFLVFILLILFGIIPGFVLRAGVVSSYQNHAVNHYVNEIFSHINLLSERLVYDGQFPGPPDETVYAQIDQLSTVYDARVFLTDHSTRIISDSDHTEEGGTLSDEEVVQALSGETVRNVDLIGGTIRLATPVYLQDASEPAGVIFLTTTTGFLQEDLSHLKRSMTLLQIMLFIALFLIGFILSGIMFRPFKRLTGSIQAVQEGYQSHFEPIETFTETAQMSEACSDMLGRLKQLDASREEFVANVSHELKTPLASMKVLSDSLLSQENVPNEIYRDFMQDIAGEIDRENSIINDLLSLVRLNRDSVELNIQEVSINDMLDLLMKRLRPIAEQQQVELLLESFRPVTAEVDEGKLTLAFSNIIENAIKYNHPEGFVHVTLNADHQNFFVNVIDNGIGIPEEAQAHIFERFYRVDKSHSRKIGGTGLGLAITRNVIVMHGGAIRVHSVEGEGTTFTVRIPLIHMPGEEWRNL